MYETTDYVGSTDEWPNKYTDLNENIKKYNLLDTFGLYIDLY